ncbi:hypothetical protein [Mycobacterium paraffinicum]|uniref:hypothetical protein n=1 Tax=Mycobacterium paraffinicum TaxID=53378 RepID=UPI001114A379|nr:hypothetical protein [Mycobacterium paraffinicum]
MESKRLRYVCTMDNAVKEDLRVEADSTSDGALLSDPTACFVQDAYLVPAVRNLTNGATSLPTGDLARWPSRTGSHCESRRIRWREFLK